MSVVYRKSDRRYSWDDYLNLPEDERWEIIDGVAYNMTPAPSIQHQGVAGRFFSRVEQKLVGQSCQPFIAPTDVVFSDHDIVQPDVLIVCDSNKVTEKNIRGAPDVVIEVLSPGTVTKDLRDKKALYERYAVREYVALDPLELYAQRFVLRQDATYGSPEIFGSQEVLALNTLPDIEVHLWEVFGVEESEERK